MDKRPVKPTRKEETPMREVTLEELTNSFNTYNENITNYDPKYNSLVPKNFKILVRVYKTVFNCTMEEDRVQTKPGQTSRTMLNPFPYSTKAIIVATDQEDYKIGDIVLLSNEAIQLVGNYEKGKRPFYLFGNEDYYEEGMLMIPINLIQCIVK